MHGKEVDIFPSTAYIKPVNAPADGAQLYYWPSDL